MRMEITFPGGDAVDARFHELTIHTVQDRTAPRPFDLFLASIGTCAGSYVERFCRKRGIPVEKIRIVQESIRNPETRMIERIEIDIQLPEEFPARYRDAVIRAADLCSVKKHLAEPPAVQVRASLASRAGP